jgi:hypothetical protein
MLARLMFEGLWMGVVGGVICTLIWACIFKKTKDGK